jgi:hypothetical protein
MDVMGLRLSLLFFLLFVAPFDQSRVRTRPAATAAAIVCDELTKSTRHAARQREQNRPKYHNYVTFILEDYSMIEQRLFTLYLGDFEFIRLLYYVRTYCAVLRRNQSV